jgi:hypothetical protein
LKIEDQTDYTITFGVIGFTGSIRAGESRRVLTADSGVPTPFPVVWDRAVSHSLYVESIVKPDAAMFISKPPKGYHRGHHRVSDSLGRLLHLTKNYGATESDLKPPQAGEPLPDPNRDLPHEIVKTAVA